MRHIPLALVLFRLVLGIIVLAAGLLDPDPHLFAFCLVGAIVSDYFDGVIARRLGVATPTLRRMDSIADSVFYICALVAIVINFPQLLLPHALPMALLFGMEGLRYGYDLRKFGKEASYHMWSSKLWGLLLFIGTYAVLVHHEGGWPVALAIYWGIAADVEGLAISMTLGHWQADVPSLWHARRMMMGATRPHD